MESSRRVTFHIDTTGEKDPTDNTIIKSGMVAEFVVSNTETDDDNQANLKITARLIRVSLFDGEGGNIPRVAFINENGDT